MSADSWISLAVKEMLSNETLELFPEICTEFEKDLKECGDAVC